MCIRDRCKTRGIKPADYDPIINKTPLSYRTNRIIGGVSPAQYLAKLEKGDKANPPIEPAKLDDYLRSHLINPDLLRQNDFPAFMADRQKRLLALIEQATDKPVYRGDVPDEGEDVGDDEEAMATDMLAPV